jgi:hypothetical protein
MKADGKPTLNMKAVMFLQNVGYLSMDYTALHPRRQYASKPRL